MTVMALLEPSEHAKSVRGNDSGRDMARKQQILSLSEAMEGLPKDFGFFAEHFSTTVQPALAAREDDRVKAVAQQRNFSIGGVLLAIAIFFGFGYFIPEDGYIFGGFIGV